MSFYAEEDLFAESKSRFYRDTDLGLLSVPKDGKLYEMYHGTTVDAAEVIIRNGFKLTRDGKLGSGVYVSRGINQAQKFPKNLELENVILKLRVNVGKCIKIEAKGHPMQKTWQSQYDCAWIPYGNPWVGSFQDRNCIADPRRIKVIGIWHAPVGQKSRLEALIKQCTKCSAAPREAALHCTAGREQESATQKDDGWHVEHCQTFTPSHISGFNPSLFCSPRYSSLDPTKCKPVSTLHPMGTVQPELPGQFLPGLETSILGLIFRDMALFSPFPCAGADFSCHAPNTHTP